MWLRWPLLVAMFAAMLALRSGYVLDQPAVLRGPLCCSVLTAGVLCLLASAGIFFYAGMSPTTAGSTPALSPC
ncbi:hypothetical protein HN018_23925 (plasmid) [Lichenicola cladoniae]|uniref:Uncharacterized protein n=1 Tax=Lichenicola cladoniae TaxID=1484109 RepID=A0A6M8HYF4_9PROT|nr:hypothetical protein [Lichenicola cladoniae]NPD69811.1 hypothetical protein [Acetobacteraceae bacterium]QKE93227.1 hypothetical protein HN018_23925 [Lichenicola cladoniae]